MTATQKQQQHQTDVDAKAAKKGSQMCTTTTTIAKAKLFPTGRHTRPEGCEVVVMMAPKSVTTTERRPRMDVEHHYTYTPCLLRNIHVQSTDPQSSCEHCGKRQRRKAMAKYRK
eukprot:3144013-Pleurochrysis_carterae.AAC.1